MTTSPKSAKPVPPLTVIQVRFGFNEGLNFGCGFFVAGFVFSIVIVPLTIFILLALGLSSFQ